MAVRASAWRSTAFSTTGLRRDVPRIVPVLALLAAALPAWLGIEVGLPRPVAREIDVYVISEQPPNAVPPLESTPVDAERQDTLAHLTLPVEDSAALIFPSPQPPIETPRRRPSLAVVGVGLQGLAMRTEPAGGEQVRVIDEGTDLRDLGDVEEAGGRLWKHVADAEGQTGWVAGEFLLSWDGVDQKSRTQVLVARTVGTGPATPRDRSWMQLPPELRSITPDQLHDGKTLPPWEAFAACAPAATVAFARATGHDMTLDQAADAARQVGWNGWLGMPGPRAELALLASLGIPAHQRGDSEDTIDWDRVVGDVQAGIPVMVVTAQHYYVAEAYDPETGRFDFGNSALVLHTSGKRRWFSPDELAWLDFGSPFTTIHLGAEPQPSEYLRVAGGAY
jgi:hypothetical protein